MIPLIGDVSLIGAIGCDEAHIICLIIKTDSRSESSYAGVVTEKAGKMLFALIIFITGIMISPAIIA